MSEYRARKKDFQYDTVELKLYFENGDVIAIDGSEVMDLKVRFYDSLVAFQDGYCPVAESGILRLKLKKFFQNCLSESHVSDDKKLRRERREYIRSRLTDETDLCAVYVYDEIGSGFFFFTQGKAKAEGEETILHLFGKREDGAEAEEHTIKLGTIRKHEIDSILLYFENCDYFSVDKTEVEEFQMTFEPFLFLDHSGYHRAVKTGQIRIRFDRYFNREHDLYRTPRKRKKFIKQLKRYLFGQDGSMVHDIVCMKIRYRYPRRLFMEEETVEVNDIRGESSGIFADDARNDEPEYYFIGGCSEELEDGNILISFGRTAVNRLQAQTEDR